MRKWLSESRLENYIDCTRTKVINTFNIFRELEVKAEVVRNAVDHD